MSRSNPGTGQDKIAGLLTVGVIVLLVGVGSAASFWKSDPGANRSSPGVHASGVANNAPAIDLLIGSIVCRDDVGPDVEPDGAGIEGPTGMEMDSLPDGLLSAEVRAMMMNEREGEQVARSGESRTRLPPGNNANTE